MEQGRCTDNLSTAITQRFTEELEQLGMPITEAARRMGESHPQRIRDVIRGRQGLPSDMLSRASTIGVDVMYVVSGTRTPKPLNGNERALLENYRAVAKQERAQLVTSHHQGA